MLIGFMWTKALLFSPRLAAVVLTLCQIVGGERASQLPVIAFVAGVLVLTVRCACAHVHHLSRILQPRCATLQLLYSFI